MPDGLGMHTELTLYKECIQNLLVHLEYGPAERAMDYRRPLHDSGFATFWANLGSIAGLCRRYNIPCSAYFVDLAEFQAYILMCCDPQFGLTN